MAYNQVTHDPAQGRGGKSPVYQIDFTAVDSGKRIASTKRRIRWRFGFSNAEAMSAGETGTACRGEEHDITLIWSITSGKRLVLADGQEVHYSNNRSHLFDFSWTMRGNHVLKVVAHANPPANASAGFRQYDFYVDGMSFFNMPKVYRLGLVGGARQQEPAGSLALATTTRGRPDSKAGGYSNYTVGSTGRPDIGDKKNSVIADIEAPHNRDEEQAYLAEAIKNSLNESAVPNHSDNRSLPPPRQNDLLVDMMSEPGIPTSYMDPPRNMNGPKPVANVMFRQDAQVARFEPSANPNPSFTNEQKMAPSTQYHPAPASTFQPPAPPAPFAAAPASPTPSYGNRTNSFTAPPAPTHYGGAPAPPQYAGAPAPPQYGGAPAPTLYGGAPAPNPFSGAPAPAPFTAAPANASFTAPPANASFTAPPTSASFSSAPETTSSNAAPAPTTNDSMPAAPTPTEETAPTPPEPVPSLMMNTKPTGLGSDADAAFAKFASMDLLVKPSSAKHAEDRENPFEDVITKAPAPTLAGMKMMGAPTEKKEVMKPDPDAMSQPGALVLSGNQAGSWNAYPPSLGSQAPLYSSLGSQAPPYNASGVQLQNSMTAPGYVQVGVAGSVTSGMTNPMQSQGNGQPQQYYGMSGNPGGSMSNYPGTMNGQNQQPQQQQQQQLPQQQQQPPQYGFQQGYVQQPQATQGYGYGAQQPR